MLDPDKPITELKVEDLSTMYTASEECDKRIFAEMRTNLQLVAGDHYIREGSKFWNRVRDNRQLTQEQRLKLTKNHIQVVTKTYRNSIESFAPGVQICAANEKELKCQKSAELAEAYWEYLKKCNNMQEQISNWIQNLVEIGEICVKVFWDMNGGQVVGYEAQMQDDGDGNMVPVMGPDGQTPMASETAVYGGKMKYVTFEAYNLRRDPDARTMKESPYLTLSQLLPKKAINALIKDDKDKQALLNSTPTSEYTIYDNNTGYYRISKGQIIVKETYFRPAPNIPNGYFYIYTDNMILEQGELPYGIFPIIHAGFDTQTGNARSHSVIRHVRPAQIEINRCASKIAEHQVTLGDDKVWISSTTKLSQGASLPGVRVNSYSGMKPEITQGRAGDQYFAYLEGQIAELYKLANLSEIMAESADSPDLYANLLKSFRFRRKFAIYGEKFERFLEEIVTVSLQIAKNSINEEELVPAVGRSEYISIPEFKNTEDIHYQIKIKPRSDDVESMFGKQLTLNHIIQYTGNSLDKEDLGQMIRLSPFLNEEQMMSKLTQKWDNSVNDILALDRGQWRPPRKFDDHKYIIERLSSRMGQSDYEYLPQPIQQMYEMKLQQHEMLQTQALIEIQKAEAGFIPSGGYLVKCDFYIGDAANPTKTKRVAIPSEALNWLIEKLKTQGSELVELAKDPEGVQQDMARMINNQNRMVDQGNSRVGTENAGGLDASRNAA